MPEVTLLDIARRLGLSKTTVSVALRGKPGLAEGTNRRILEVAQEMGYRPNPVSRELMDLVRAKRHKSSVQTIAFLNTFMEPGLLRRIPGLYEFVSGSQARAEKYGYKVEVFDARAPGMTEKRLAGILKARGIRGVIVGPRWAMEPELEFPWECFATVLVGEQEYAQRLHRVCNHHIHCTVTVLRMLAAKGYRNVGLSLVAEQERKFGYDYLLGVEQYRHLDNGPLKVTSWLYTDWSEESGEAWLRKHNFDAVVSLSDEPARLFARSFTNTGDRLGYASLGMIGDAGWSGIDQHLEDIGGAAVDLLRGLLISGERGTSPRPHVLLIEGEWIEGDTTPGPRTVAAEANIRPEN